MPRYFFNIVTSGGTIVDHEGTQLPDLDHARAEAIADARGLMSIAIMQGLTIFDQKVEISGENGKILLELPFSEAIKSSD